MYAVEMFQYQLAPYQSFSYMAHFALLAGSSLLDQRVARPTNAAVLAENEKRNKLQLLHVLLGLKLNV